MMRIFVFMILAPDDTVCQMILSAGGWNSVYLLNRMPRGSVPSAGPLVNPRIDRLPGQLVHQGSDMRAEKGDRRYER
jgi:hypothetical protein